MRTFWNRWAIRSIMRGRKRKKRNGNRARQMTYPRAVLKVYRSERSDCAKFDEMYRMMGRKILYVACCDKMRRFFTFPEYNRRFVHTKKKQNKFNNKLNIRTAQSSRFLRRFFDDDRFLCFRSRPLELRDLDRLTLRFDFFLLRCLDFFRFSRFTLVDFDLTVCGGGE